MGEDETKVTELMTQVVTLERSLADKDAKIDELLRYGKCIDLRSEKREMLTLERAKELLGSPDGDVTSITFGTKSFGKDAAGAAAEVLKKLTSLCYADLSDIIAGRPEAEALEVLQIICGALPAKEIKALDLSENALGEKGIRALEAILTSLVGLEEIKFMNNGLSELSVDLLAQCLPVSNLKVLHFHNNMSGSGGAVAAAKILSSCKKIRDFRMSSSRVAAEGGLPMLKAVAGLSETLVKLNLSDSMLDEECTEVLVGALPKMTKLTDLILRDTGVENEPVLEALKDPSNLPMLSILDLSGLEIDEETSKMVGQILRARPRIRKLWLDDNDLETPGAVYLANSAVPGSLLELLSVQSNRIGHIGALSLTKLALLIPTLKVLELNDNQISATGVVKIQQTFERVGRQNILGSLEDNAESDDEDEEEEESTEQDEDQLDGLISAMNNNMSIAK